jgi:hypothetical protein
MDGCGRDELDEIKTCLEPQFHNLNGDRNYHDTRPNNNNTHTHTHPQRPGKRGAVGAKAGWRLRPLPSPPGRRGWCW